MEMFLPTSSSVFGSVIGVSSAVTFDVVVVFFGVVLVVLIPCCFLSLSSRFFCSAFSLPISLFSLVRSASLLREVFFNSFSSWVILSVRSWSETSFKSLRDKSTDFLDASSFFWALTMWSMAESYCFCKMLISPVSLFICPPSWS